MNEIEARLTALGVASLTYRPDMNPPCWVVWLGYFGSHQTFSGRSPDHALLKAERYKEERKRNR
jgi:hypothetical protein